MIKVTHKRKQIKGTQESEEQKVYETAYGCTELLKGKVSDKNEHKGYIP